MFFSELEQLRQRYPNLSLLITQLDVHLSQFDASGIAKPADFASFLHADINQVVALFDHLVSVDILIPLEMCECTHCQTLINAAEVKTCRVTGDELLCPNCGTDFLQQTSRLLKVFRLSPHALHETAKNQMTPKVKADQIVILIHGILTDAVWQEKVASELNLIPGVKAIPIGYGIVELFMFWFPFFTRSVALGTVIRKVRHAIILNPGAKVSVIAHSFGTYCICRILREHADIRFSRVILCGCIVSDRYPWDFVQPRVEEQMINDCGTRDMWPAAAKTLTWGYGATGTFGFKSPGISDRFHDFDHSGFFDDEFVKKYWVPYITNGEFVTSPWTSERPPSPLFVKALATIPIQWTFTFVIVWISYYLWK